MSYHRIKKGHPSYERLMEARSANLWMCDATSHNSTGGCRNPRCFKYVPPTRTYERAKRGKLFAVRPCEIRNVVEYLQSELGLKVYGAPVDYEKKTYELGCVDYPIDDVMKLRAALIDGVEFEEAKP